jgi:hypothetical protein
VEGDLLCQVTVAFEPKHRDTAVVAEHEEGIRSTGAFEKPDVFRNNREFGWWQAYAADERLVFGVADDASIGGH